MKFWDDGKENSTRIKNVNYCWPELKFLTSYLRNNSIDCDCKLYDFSPEQILEESIHISYPAGEYKKAEKTNLILKNNPGYDYIFMFDIDTFFIKEDYEKLLNILKNVDDNEIYTFDLAKLDDDNLDLLYNNGVFDLESVHWNYAYSGDKKNGPLGGGHMGGLGGVYMCDVNLILYNGGFNEKYVGWGGEDGDMLDRIMTSGKPYKIKPTSTFAPFHLPHFSDWGNEKYSKRFL
jgi:hypothetical protein